MMTAAHRELMWTWILRFVNLVRVVSAVILFSMVAAHFEWLRAFLKSEMAGGWNTVLFSLSVILPLIPMFLWFRNYKYTAMMIRSQELSERLMLKISYNLFTIFSLDFLADALSHFAPQFSYTRTSTVSLPMNGTITTSTYSADAPPVQTTDLITPPVFNFSLNDKITYLTPVTEGLATLVLACVILYWAKSLAENKALKSELSEIV